MLNPRGLAPPIALGGVLCALVGALLLAAPPALAQVSQAAETPAYRTTIDDAVREFASGHWEEARALFKRAHDISPNARTLRGMGMAAFELRMYTQAIRELDAALRDTRKPLEGELRSQVSQLMEKSREFVGRVTFIVEPPEAKLLVDGQEPEREADGSVLLDVGTHVISANADRYKPTNLRLSVEGGMDESVRVPLEPLLTMQEGVPALDPAHPPPTMPETDAAKTAEAPPRDTTLQTAAWITLAGAAAFGITSGVLYFAVAQGQLDDIEARKAQTCKEMGGCTKAEVADFIDGYIDDSGIHTSETLATVFLIAAGASAVASGVMFAIDLGSGESAPASGAAASRVKLALSPTGMALRGQF